MNVPAGASRRVVCLAMLNFAASLGRYFRNWPRGVFSASSI